MYIYSYYICVYIYIHKWASCRSGWVHQQWIANRSKAPRSAQWSLRQEPSSTKVWRRRWRAAWVVGRFLGLKTRWKTMGNSEPKDGKDDGIWIRNLTRKRIRDIKWDGLFMSILLLDNHPFIVVWVHGDSLGSTNWFSVFFETAQVGEAAWYTMTSRRAGVLSP